MPFEVKKIDPLDLQPRKAVGVSLPFSGKAVFNQTFETKEAIKNNLIHFFLTGIGERFMNPTFGSGLRPLLFEKKRIYEDKKFKIQFNAKDDNIVEYWIASREVSDVVTAAQQNGNCIVGRLGIFEKDE